MIAKTIINHIAPNSGITIQFVKYLTQCQVGQRVPGTHYIKNILSTTLNPDNTDTHKHKQAILSVGSPKPD